MIDGENFFDQPVRNDLMKFDDIRKIAKGQGDDCTTGCSLGYNYFKMIAIELCKQEAPDADPKAILVKFSFTGNLD